MCSRQPLCYIAGCGAECKNTGDREQNDRDFTEVFMRRSSGPRKTTNLSESTHQQINMYAIAAGAAGVCVLGLAQPSEAKIDCPRVASQLPVSAPTEEEKHR
jgi:hypothetical protein